MVRVNLGKIALESELRGKIYTMYSMMVMSGPQGEIASDMFDRDLERLIDEVEEDKQKLRAIDEQAYQRCMAIDITYFKAWMESRHGD